MFHKALWKLNYKHSKFLIWALWLVPLYFLPFTYYQKAQKTAYLIKKFPDFHYEYYPNLQWTIFEMFILIGLASVLIGLERSSSTMDFSFSLPFQRTTLFLSKWFIGVTHIFGATTISSALVVLVIKTSILDRFEDVDTWLWFYLFSLLTFIAVYTFSLFVGTICGSIFSQISLNIIFLYLPYGLFELMMSFIQVHWSQGNQSFYLYSDKIRDFFNAITLPKLLFFFEEYSATKESFQMGTPSLMLLVIPILYIIVSLILGVLLYKHAHCENNGKILVFDRLKPFFMIGVIICFSMFGGSFFAQDNFSDQSNIFSYYIRAILTGTICYFILRKVMNTRFQWGKR